MGRMITTREAADELNLSIHQIRKLIRLGRLTGEAHRSPTRNRNYWLVDTDSVEAYKTADRKPGLKPGQKLNLTNGRRKRAKKPEAKPALLMAA